MQYITQQNLSKTTKLLLAVAATLLLACYAVALTPQKAAALSESDFNAGRIIDDSVFYNNSTMNSTQIQQFLNSKVPVCDTNGEKWHPATGRTRAEHGIANGVPPPYTCLKDYSQTVPTITNGGSDLCTGSIVGGTKSAAQIIYDAANACGINPQVLIVLLQKEQSLITDDWPWPIQYRSATGYGCPDGAPCDSQYYGFFNQVYQAAKAYKRYRANPTNYNYRAERNNTILWNPNSSCGSSTVFIENQATAGLYIYTPYRPNSGSLAHKLSGGRFYATSYPDCGAYGNINFWQMFNNWFGSTVGPAFHATYQSQSAYPVIDSGLGISVFFQFKNTGTAFWKDDMSNFPGYRPVHIATTNPINRASGFRASNWLTPSRTTGTFSKVYESDGVTLAPEQHTVQPGQIARFEFTIHVDPGIPPGVYREHFQPILEGAPDYTWHMGGSAYLDIGVNRPAHKAAYYNQSAYPTIPKGSSSPAHLAFKNVGTSPWFDDISAPIGKRSVHLATSWPINRVSKFGASWPSVNRPGLNFTSVFEADGVTLASAQHTVQPGQIARFEFDLNVPADTPSGEYKEYFEPVIEGAPNYGWGMGVSAWLGITVP